MRTLLTVLGALMFLFAPQLSGHAQAATPLDRTVFAIGDPAGGEEPGKFNVKALEVDGDSWYFWNGDHQASWQLVQYGQSRSIMGIKVRFAAGTLDGKLDGIGGGTDDAGRLAVVRLELARDPAALPVVERVALLRTLAGTYADLIDRDLRDFDDFHASFPVVTKQAGRSFWLVYRFPVDLPAIDGRSIILRLYPPAPLDMGNLPDPAPAPVPVPVPTSTPTPPPPAAPPPVTISREEACELITGDKAPDERIANALATENLVIGVAGAVEPDLLVALLNKTATKGMVGSSAKGLAAPMLAVTTALGITPCVPIGDTSLNSLVVNATGAVDSLIGIFSHLPWFLGFLWFAAGLVQLLIGVLQIFALMTRPGYTFLENLTNLVTTNDGLNAVATSVAGLAGVVGGVTLVLGIGALVLMVATIVAAVAACFQFTKDYLKALQVNR